MNRFCLGLSILLLLITACRPIPTSSAPAASEQASTPQAGISSIAPSETPSPSATAPATGTATAEPAGLIRVDTLEQEVYPFVENGKCSLGEAIFAANAGEPKDNCAAGVQGNPSLS